MGKKSDSEQAFRQLAASRRSVRDFLDTPVPAEVIESILSDAVLAPSWSNTRPYRFAVATGDTRDRISAALLGRAEDLLEIRSSKPLSRLRAALKAPGLLFSDFRIPVVYPKDLRQRQGQLGAALFGHLGVERSDRSGRGDFVKRNMEFFGAPTAVFVFARSGMGVYSALDAGLAMQNLMLSATAHGLGTCPQGFLAFWSKPIRKEFDVPRGYKLLCGISLGYPSDGPINDFVPPVTTVEDVNLLWVGKKS
jgi:nitroreductase